jgi:hypothetical protein
LIDAAFSFVIFRAGWVEVRSPPVVIPGLVPGIHIDGRAESGHDERIIDSTE